MHIININRTLDAFVQCPFDHLMVCFFTNNQLLLDLQWSSQLHATRSSTEDCHAINEHQGPTSRRVKGTIKIISKFHLQQKLLLYFTNVRHRNYKQ